MSAPIIVDASVATAWVVEERISTEASALLTSGASLIAPDLLVAEVGNAVWKAERRGEVSQREVLAVREVLRRGLNLLHPTLPLLPMASALARDFSHPIYDCFYLALAQREGGEVATADARLARLCAAKGVGVRLIAPPQPQPSPSA